MKLKWTTHGDLAIARHDCVGREEYLDYMTFRKNDRTLYTEVFGPLVGIKEEWEQQGATPEELDFSAFTYCAPRKYRLAVNTGLACGPERVIEETDEYVLSLDGLGRMMRLMKGVATLPLPESWPVIDAFIEAGINCMFPFEPAAGMDIVKTREQYGDKLAFTGGINKYTLMKGRDDILAELEYKVPPMVKSGACVLGLDHRIPSGVSLENYRFYLRKLQELLTPRNKNRTDPSDPTDPSDCLKERTT